MARPTDITGLRDQLLDAYDLLARDPKREGQVAELANTAGKVLATVKHQIEYAALRGEQPDIAFMGKTSGVPLPHNTRRLLA